MVKNQKFTVNTTDALVAAIVAYRLNQEQVLRFDSAKGITDNKQLILNYFLNPVDVPDLEELKELAETIRASIDHRIMMSTLIAEKNNEFLLTVGKTIRDEKVTTRDFGIISWAPKLYFDNIRNDEIKEELRGMGISSKHIGQVGKKISITFHMTSCKYLRNFDTFMHQGHDGMNNLVMFFNKNRITGGVPITARVKTHRKDQKLADSRVTVLNYVKVVE